MRQQTQIRFFNYTLANGLRCIMRLIFMVDLQSRIRMAEYISSVVSVIHVIHGECKTAGPDLYACLGRPVPSRSFARETRGRGSPDGSLRMQGPRYVISRAGLAAPAADPRGLAG